MRIGFRMNISIRSLGSRLTICRTAVPASQTQTPLNRSRTTNKINRFRVRIARTYFDNIYSLEFRENEHVYLKHIHAHSSHSIRFANHDMIIQVYTGAGTPRVHLIDLLTRASGTISVRRRRNIQQIPTDSYEASYIYIYTHGSKFDESPYSISISGYTESSEFIWQ